MYISQSCMYLCNNNTLKSWYQNINRTLMSTYGFFVHYECFKQLGLLQFLLPYKFTDRPNQPI